MKAWRMKYRYTIKLGQKDHSTYTKVLILYKRMWITSLSEKNTDQRVCPTDLFTQ